MSEQDINQRQRMLEDRRAFFDEFVVAAGRHRERAFEYEREAVAIVNNGLRTLTYLCGGGLVAIPAAVALFKTDAQHERGLLIMAALLFVAGLVLVMLTQVFTFFTMARRSEAETMLEYEQTILLGVSHFPPADQIGRSKAIGDAGAKRSISDAKVKLSNYWRMAGIASFWLALACFIAGCYFGAKAIVS